MSKTGKIGCQKKMFFFLLLSDFRLGNKPFFNTKGDSTGCYRLLYVMQQLNFAGCKNQR